MADERPFKVSATAMLLMLVGTPQDKWVGIFENFLGDEAATARKSAEAERDAERAKVAERDARIATLEDAIRKAPHAEGCHDLECEGCSSPSAKCDCWKRAALGAPEGQPPTPAQEPQVPDTVIEAVFRLAGVRLEECGTCHHVEWTVGDLRFAHSVLRDLEWLARRKCYGFVRYGVRYLVYLDGRVKTV